MVRRILMIDPDERNFLSLKSLLDTLDGNPLTLDWLRRSEDVHDPSIFDHYDMVLTRHASEAQSIPAKLREEQEFNALKARFVTMASHEIRTPLTSIASSADLAATYIKKGDTERAEKHLTRIRNGVQDLNLIINQTLALSQVTEGKIKVHFQEMSLPGLISDVCASINYLLKPDQMIVCSHSGSHSVSLDPILMKIILLNLVSNASKYSPPKSHILLSSNVEPDAISISVSDQGIGIPEEDHHRLFDRFFRAINATNIQGTGLGLHLAKKYVEMMRGVIRFSSELGKGTTFWVEFGR